MRMDPRPPSCPPDIPAILDLTRQYEVQFVLVGSVAVMAHGLELVPGDIDLVPALDPPNLERIVALLHDVRAVPEGFGYWITAANGRRKWIDQGFSPELVDRWQPLTGEIESLDYLFRTPLGNLDVVPTLAGSFEELLPGSVERRIAGHTVRVPPIADLIARLQYSNRPKDQERIRGLQLLSARTPE